MFPGREMRLYVRAWRGFSPEFRCGGMAERSMAVVLKTDQADPQNSRFLA